MNNRIHIGNRIKYLLDKNGMKKILFAEKLGYTKNGIYKIFENENINTDTLYNIADILNLSITEFFVDNYNAENKPSLSSEPTMQYNENANKTPNKNNSELDILKSEFESLKKEINYLKEINELLKKNK